jgi:hypothetical protein
MKSKPKPHKPMPPTMAKMMGKADKPMPKKKGK